MICTELIMAKLAGSITISLVFGLLNASSGLAQIEAPEAFTAPEISDEAYAREVTQRRARMAETIGPSGVLVLLAGEPRRFSGSVNYEFRQENYFFYLTRLQQTGAALVLMPGHARTPEILFLPRRDPKLEIWTGAMYSAEDASRLSGIDEIWEAAELEPFLEALKSRVPYRPTAENVLASTLGTPPEDAPGDYEHLFEAAAEGTASLFLLIPRRDDPEYRREQDLAADWARTRSGFNLQSAFDPLIEMRSIKSSVELDYIRHAINITGEALRNAFAALPDAQYEYEIEGEIEGTFRKLNATSWAFPSIVASGANATTLHYESSAGRIRRDELLLMDIGAEYGQYAADVTRTVPADGSFSSTQAEVYRIVHDAQQSAADAVEPGATLRTIHEAAVEVMKRGLLDLGLITDAKSDQYQTWVKHGTSHYLGLNVHDPGLRGAEIRPGMVFTIEPGIYIRLDALDHLPDTAENRAFIEAVRPAHRKYAGIGVRIEDDILVSDSVTPIWLTRSIPSSISAIEEAMAQARKSD